LTSASEDIALRSDPSSLHPLNPSLGVGKPHTFANPDEGKPQVVWSKNGLVVKTFRNNHIDCKISVGYRIEFAGRVVVISGDTIKSPSVIQNSAEADLLIHEVTNKKLALDIADLAQKKLSAEGAVAAKRIRNVIRHHSHTLDVAEVARDARAAKLVLTHVIPGIPAHPILKHIFIEGMSSIYKGPIVLAKDGDHFYLSPLKN